MPRAAAALMLLLAVAGGQLVDALLGGRLMGSPVLLLASAVAGYLVGASSPGWRAAPAVVVAAAALTASYQLGDPGAYPLLDDLVFALLVVGAPALAGAAVRKRAEQVKELDRLARLLDARRRTEARLARLEERNRVQTTLHRGFSEQVAAIAMRTESAVGADDAAARAALADVESAARAALDQLRETLGDLRGDLDGVQPPVEDPAPPADDVPWEPPVGRGDVLLGVGSGLLLAVEAVVSPQAQGPPVLNALLGFAAGLPLVARRHRPLAVCTATPALLAAMALWLTPSTEMVTTILPVLVCAYTAGAHLRGTLRRAAAMSVLLLGIAAAAWAGPPVTGEDDGLLPMLVVVALSFVVGTVTAGWTSRAAQRRAAVDALERSREAEVGLAVAEQRDRLASELHDTVAHAMTVICLQASAAQVLPERAALDTILSTARDSLRELRHGVDELVDTHDLGTSQLTALAARAGLRPVVVVSGRLDDVPTESRRVAVRLLREALTNAGRHAPGSRVQVAVESGPQLRLSVHDEGARTDRGVAVPGTGTGLRGLAAEAQRIGGTVSWGPAGAGFRVEATLPGAGVRV